jgi:hypothetical protein
MAVEAFELSTYRCFDIWVDGIPCLSSHSLHPVLNGLLPRTDGLEGDLRPDAQLWSPDALGGSLDSTVVCRFWIRCSRRGLRFQLRFLRVCLLTNEGERAPPYCSTRYPYPCTGPRSVRAYLSLAWKTSMSAGVLTPTCSNRAARV